MKMSISPAKEHEKALDKDELNMSFNIIRETNINFSKYEIDAIVLLKLKRAEDGFRIIKLIMIPSTYYGRNAALGASHPVAFIYTGSEDDRICKSLEDVELVVRMVTLMKRRAVILDRDYLHAYLDGTIPPLKLETGNDPLVANNALISYLDKMMIRLLPKAIMKRIRKKCWLPELLENCEDQLVLNRKDVGTIKIGEGNPKNLKTTEAAKNMYEKYFVLP